MLMAEVSDVIPVKVHGAVEPIPHWLSTAELVPCLTA